jgi:exodeoxyribonuclease VII small subunit
MPCRKLRPMVDPQPNLQSELDKLEAIVRDLEDENLDLDRAIAMFEEGVRHLRTARELLSKSELTVRKVLEESDGSVRFDDIDD